MNNILKLLSTNKDYRIVIADTAHVARRQLLSFKGRDEIRTMLEQVITNCTLLAAMNDMNQKISFSFRLSQSVSIFSSITNARFSLEYTDALHGFAGSVAELFHPPSVLSITTGDWTTGLHTGTVEARIDDIGMLLSHFTVQSEQLPGHFIMGGQLATRGLLMQPLPFADDKAMTDSAAELVYLSRALETTKWDEVPDLYRHLANVVSESKMD